MPPNLFCMLNRKNEFYDATGNGTAFHHGIGLVCYCQLGFRAIGNRLCGIKKCVTFNLELIFTLFLFVGNRTVQCNNQEWTSEFPNCQGNELVRKLVMPTVQLNNLHKFTLEIFCENPPFLIPRGVNHSIAWQRHWQIGLHNFSCPEKLVINGRYLLFTLHSVT